MSAERAIEFGLVNRVVPDADLAQAAHELALQIGTKSAYTIKVGKEAFYKQIEMSLADAYEYTTEVMVEKHARQRCRGRHRRVHRKTPAAMGRSLRRMDPHPLQRALYLDDPA